MSIFSDNITNELSYIEKGKSWMIQMIQSTIDYFASEFAPGSEIFDTDEQARMFLQQQIIYCWLNKSIIKEFHITGTETIINPSTIRGYKYDVIVNVRFDDCTDPEDYVPFVKVHVIKT